MTFPTYNAISNNEPTNVTSQSVVLHSSYTAGDLIIAILAIDGSAAPVAWDNTTAGTWTALQDADNNGGVLYACIFWKLSDGTEGGKTLEVTSASQQSAATVIRIQGWDGTTAPEISTGVVATTSTPDPGSLTPSWGAEDNLYIAVAFQATGVNTVTSYPTNYVDGVNSVSTGAGGTATGVAFRQIAGSPEDPGTFTFSGSSGTNSFTIGVRPAAASTSAALNSSGAATFTGASAALAASALSADGTSTMTMAGASTAASALSADASASVIFEGSSSAATSSAALSADGTSSAEFGAQATAAAALSIAGESSVTWISAAASTTDLGGSRRRPRARSIEDDDAEVLTILQNHVLPELASRIKARRT